MNFSEGMSRLGIFLATLGGLAGAYIGYGEGARLWQLRVEHERFDLVTSSPRVQWHIKAVPRLLGKQAKARNPNFYSNLSDTEAGNQIIDRIRRTAILSPSDSEIVPNAFGHSDYYQGEHEGVQWIFAQAPDIYVLDKVTGRKVKLYEAAKKFRAHPNTPVEMKSFGDRELVFAMVDKFPEDYQLEREEAPTISSRSLKSLTQAEYEKDERGLISKVLGFAIGISADIICSSIGYALLSAGGLLGDEQLKTEGEKFDKLGTSGRRSLMGYKPDLTPYKLGFNEGAQIHVIELVNGFKLYRPDGDQPSKIGVTIIPLLWVAGGFILPALLCQLLGWIISGFINNS